MSHWIVQNASSSCTSAEVFRFLKIEKEILYPNSMSVSILVEKKEFEIILPSSEWHVEVDMRLISSIQCWSTIYQKLQQYSFAWTVVCWSMGRSVSALLSIFHMFMQENACIFSLPQFTYILVTESVSNIPLSVRCRCEEVTMLCLPTNGNRNMDVLVDALIANVNSASMIRQIVYEVMINGLEVHVLLRELLIRVKETKSCLPDLSKLSEILSSSRDCSSIYVNERSVHYCLSLLL